ncbi:ABC transporter substrate-binding protein [Carboxylicivirga sp. RSCT41]|uniref:ABC transporter substrate-binding protein n=1 Tax=Carboxylicivirga agarovorans TaxID=3417570 RepID=UPI003D34DF0E
MIRFSTIVFALLLILGACQTKQKGNSPDTTGNEPDSVFQPKYAKGFEIRYYKDYRQIVLNDPWGDSTKNESIALFYEESLKSELQKTNDYVIGYPAKQWIALSSTMVNYADKLNVKSGIKGVAEPQYISDDYIQEGISNGSIKNVGMAVAPDVEVMVDLEPDFMMVSPFKDNHFAAVTSAGIPVLTNADYLEHTPLGRAEWIVFMGELLGRGEMSKQIFEEIETAYLEVKKKVENIDAKHTVFTGHIYQGIWYSPAGESYMANFFNDAGTDYIYKETKGTGSLSLDYETIIDKAEHTDCWVLIINYPGELTYSELAKIDDRYTDFDAYKNRNMVVTNASNSLYFEKGLLQPHIVLSDLVHAIYPEVLDGYKPRYFHKLTKE